MPNFHRGGVRLKFDAAGDIVPLVTRCEFCQKAAPASARLPPCCPSCGAAHPYDVAAAAGAPLVRRAARAVRVADVPRAELRRLVSGVAEFDAALSGGLALPSTLLLVGGEGTGKTTLALRVAAGCAARARRPALVVTAEQPAQLVAAYLARLGCDAASAVYVLETDCAEVGAAEARRLRACVVVWDSVPRLALLEREAALDATQRAVGWLAVDVARETQGAALLISHTTAEDKPAGPRALRFDLDGWARLERGARLTLEKWRHGPAPRVVRVAPPSAPTPTRSRPSSSSSLRLVK